MKRFLRTKTLLVVSFGIISFLFSVCCTHAQSAQFNSSSWSHFGTPKVVDSNDPVTTYDVVESKRRFFMGAHGQRLCNKKVATMYEGFDIESCWYSSAIGEFSDYGNAWIPIEKNPGFIGQAADQRIIPTLNPKVFLEFRPLDTGFQLNFRTVEDAQFDILADYPNGPTFYEWAGPALATLKHQNGEAFPISDSMTAVSMWYGKTGRYLLVADEARGSLMRIDLLTFKVLTAHYKLSESENTFGMFDITDDGKKVVANIFGESPRIIHLDTCIDGGEESYVSDPRVCPMSSLGGALKDFDEQTYGLAEFVHFKEDHILEIYARSSNKYDASNSSLYGRFYMYAPGTWRPDNRYIALGDSYSSGEGAGNYYAGTDLRNLNMCHLSKKSYPFLLKNDLSITQSLKSVACSGAKIHNVYSLNSSSDNPEVDEWATNQFSMTRRDIQLDDWTPGRYQQISYFEKYYQPGIVTVGIGGNDMGFGSIVEQCVDPRIRKTCFEDERDRAFLIEVINEQEPKLIELYEAIKQKAALGARVYAIGYPEVVKPNGDCGVNVLLNASEIDFVESITRYMNAVIKSAASKAGVRYITLAKSLHHYRLCEGHLSAMNGATLTNWSQRRYISPESYHPNSFGHELFADEIKELTNDFELDNPRPSGESYMPTASQMVAAGLFASEQSLLKYQGQLFYYQPLQDRVLAKGDTQNVSLLGSAYGLLANSPFQVWLNSDPVHLGNYATDSSGNLSFNLSVPATVPTGFHTLRIIGKGSDTTDREVRAILYVAHSYEDWDGDGVLNSNQVCPYQIQDPKSGELIRDWCVAPLSEKENDVSSVTKKRSSTDYMLAATGQDSSGILKVAIISFVISTLFIAMRVRCARCKMYYEGEA
jgi:lysophospholipase L1-like esterase